MRYSPYYMIHELSNVYYGSERVNVIKKFGQIYNISSGVSSLSMPKKYKELICQEIQTDLFYRWYTSAEGSNVVIAAILFFENYLAGKGKLVSEFTRDNIVTSIGSTEVIESFFEYYAKTMSNKNVFLVGLNYFLLSHCCVENELTVVEIISEEASRTFPTVHELVNRIETEKPGLLVLSVPGNPSGEVYTEEELEVIFKCLLENNTFLLLDRVCLDELSYSDYYVNLSALIVKTSIKDRVLMVNSLSKTRNIAGMRIGYSLANEEIINYIKQKKYLRMFSGPSTGGLMIAYDMLVRCIIYAVKVNDVRANDAINNILQYFNYYMKFSCPLSPGELDKRDLTSCYFDGDLVRDEMIKTIGELEIQYSTIKQNINYSMEILKDYLCDYILPVSGYNHIVKIDRLQTNQFNTAITFFRNFGLELLTEKCFRMSQEVEKENNYWIRITSAASTDWFSKAMEQFVQAIRRI